MTTIADRSPLAWTARQRTVYARRYRTWRALHDLVRYDVRYRVLLMEEIFHRFEIPFEHQKVFELGFGSGTLLLRFDTTSSLHGAELSEGAVAALTTDKRCGDYRQTHFVRCTADGMPVFPELDYDLVLASHVIEHVPDDRAALRALWAHTRVGGYGLFFLPLERPRHNPDHARTYTKAGFNRLLREVGYTPVHVEENFRYASHWVQVVNWPSRARIPVLGAVVEVLKCLALALPPTSFVRLVEAPLARLHVAPYQLCVLAQRQS